MTKNDSEKERKKEREWKENGDDEKSPSNDLEVMMIFMITIIAMMMIQVWMMKDGDKEGMMDQN